MMLLQTLSASRSLVFCTVAVFPLKSTHQKAACATPCCPFIHIY